MLRCPSRNACAAGVPLVPRVPLVCHAAPAACCAALSLGHTSGICPTACAPSVLPSPTPQGLCDDDDSPARTADVWELPDAEGKGPVYFVEGSASEAASLRQAGASTARALIYLARAGGQRVRECGMNCSPGGPQQNRSLDATA